MMGNVLYRATIVAVTTALAGAAFAGVAAAQANESADVAVSGATMSDTTKHHDPKKGEDPKKDHDPKKPEPVDPKKPEPEPVDPKKPEPEPVDPKKPEPEPVDPKKDC